MRIILLTTSFGGNYVFYWAIHNYLVYMFLSIGKSFIEIDSMNNVNVHSEAFIKV